MTLGMLFACLKSWKIQRMKSGIRFHVFFWVYHFQILYLHKWEELWTIDLNNGSCFTSCGQKYIITITIFRSRFIEGTVLIDLKLRDVLVHNQPIRYLLECCNKSNTNNLQEWRILLVHVNITAYIQLI